MRALLDPRAAALALLGALAALPLAACAGSVPADALPGRGPLVTLVDEAGGRVPDAELWVVDRRTLRADAAVLASRITGDWVETSRRMATERLRSDERGLARLGESPSRGVMIAARKGALFGSIELRAIDGEGLTLSLRPRTAYRVRVLDDSGRPAAGVPLTLAVPGEPRPQKLPVTARTGADGVAVLFEPPAVALVGLRRPPTGARRVALARVATREPVLAEVDPVGIGEAVLPPCGEVRVRLTHGGFPEGHWAGVLQVFPARKGSRSDATLAEPVVGSVAEVGHVERGLDLRAVVVVGEREGDRERLIGSLDRRLEGLDAAGADGVTPQGNAAERALALDRGLLVEGRLVDGAGAPRVGVVAQAMVEGEPSTTWSLQSGEDGRFRWLVVGPGDPATWSALRIGGRRDGVTVPLTAPAAGATLALGDVVLP